MAEQEFVIVGEDGTEHVFPEGMDPKRAADIVRRQSQPTGDSYKGPDTFMEGAAASLKDTATRTAKAAGGAVLSALDPRNLLATAKDAGTLMSNPGRLVTRSMEAGPAMLDAAQRVASGDPEAGGAAIGTLATGLVGPRLVSGMSAGMRRAGIGTMQSALKPTDTLVKARRAAGYGTKPQIAEAVLQEGRTVSSGGLRKAQDALDATDATAQARLAAGTGRGVTVDALRVGQDIEAVGAPSGVFGRQVNAQPDLAAVRDVADNFIANPNIPQTGQIPAAEAHQFATNTGKNLRGKFGRLGNATVEAEKAGRESIMSSLRTQIPELDDLWKTEARQITVRDALEGALNRTGNRDPIGLGAIVGAVRNPALALTAAADRSAILKSLLARLLYQGGRVVPPELAMAAASAGALQNAQNP